MFAAEVLLEVAVDPPANGVPTVEVAPVVFSTLLDPTTVDPVVCGVEGVVPAGAGTPRGPG